MSQKEYKNIKIIGLDFTAQIEVELIDGDIKNIEHEDIELYDQNNNKFENKLLKKILTYEDENIFRKIENNDNDEIELYRENIKNVKTIDKFKEEVINYSKTIFENNIILKKTAEEIKKELEKEGYNEFHIQKLIKHKNHIKDFCINVRILEDLINEQLIKHKNRIKDFCINVRILEDLINEQYINLKNQDNFTKTENQKKVQKRQKIKPSHI